MKVPNKRELQQIVFHHLSNIDFQDFMGLYKNCSAKQYSFLVMILLFNQILFRKNIKAHHDS